MLQIKNKGRCNLLLSDLLKKRIRTKDISFLWTGKNQRSKVVILARSEEIISSLTKKGNGAGGGWGDLTREKMRK